MDENKEKFVLYLGGGTMSGVFGAGVVTALQDMDIYNKIEAVYSGSCGSANGSYFLSKQTRVGSSIYYEDLTHNFINKKNFIKSLRQRIIGIFYKISRNKIVDIIDIKYLFHIFQSDPKKRLDIKKIQNQLIPFYVRVFNISKNKIEYINFKEHRYPFKILKASMNITPYSSDQEEISGNKYADGTILNLIDLEYLKNKYPQRKIVIVFNENSRRTFIHYIKSFLEGLLSIYIYGAKSIIYFIKGESKLRKDIKFIRKDKKIFFISPPPNSPTNPATTNARKLKITYQMGIKAAQKIKNFID